jgi:hypothetical protein
VRVGEWTGREGRAGEGMAGKDRVGEGRGGFRNAIMPNCLRGGVGYVYSCSPDSVLRARSNLLIFAVFER